MSEKPAVLFANDAFYVAFAGRDDQAMNAIWSQGPSITCIHPGWRPLTGRDAVMESWRAILANPGLPRIDCRNATAHVLGNVAYVVCSEAIGGRFLAATNIFLREKGSWRMVHHQAGAALPPPDVDAPRERLQ